MSDLAPVIADITAILKKATGAEEEGRILELLRPLSPESMAATLQEVNQDRLLQALDDHRWGPKSRKEFLRVMSPAIPHLNIEAKAALVRGLAQGTTELAAQHVIISIFKSEEGEQLTSLKLLIDCSTDGRDLLHIIEDHVTAADLRFDLVSHFQKSSVGDNLRVVSDIDDTLYSSLNDIRYPKGTIYPGVLELLGALSPHPPVFLTARPELVGSLFERITHKQLAGYGIKRCTVLSGSIPGLLGHRRMAEQKARTLTSYRELYPEFKFVFIGDSGQGDMAMAESLLTRKPRLIEHAFIHRLGGHQPGSESTHKRIFTFENYALAAARFGELGYLSSSQVQGIEQTVT